MSYDIFEAEIVSNFQRLSNLADFNKMSTKETEKIQGSVEIHENASPFKVLAKNFLANYG